MFHLEEAAWHDPAASSKHNARYFMFLQAKEATVIIFHTVHVFLFVIDNKYFQNEQNTNILEQKKHTVINNADLSDRAV
jgi:hypothetical protein